MELQTIRQISLDYGISRRMLCYYEEIGLIKSIRKDDYAYRVYEESEIRKLQQIIILRKLQIPVKQIKGILNNQNAVTVVDVFKRKIIGLDEEITALSAIRSILAQFIDELQQQADVRLKFDLLNDKTMISLVDFLTFTKHKIKEKASMEDLDKASELLGKKADRDIRVITLPPATVACAYDPDDNPDLDLQQEGKNEYEGRATLSIIQKFIDDTDLFRLKPDARVYGWGDTVNGKKVYMMWVTIPDDLEVPAPLWKDNFNGGLYAKTSSASVNHDEWMAKNGYEWDRVRKHNQFMNELINPVSLFGAKSADSEMTGFMYADSLMPIRKIKVWSDDSVKTELAKLDELFSHSQAAEVDLTKMLKHGDLDIAYENRAMVIRKEGFDGFASGIETPMQFKVPLKIEMRAKTNSTNIIIRFARGGIGFQDLHLGDTLCVTDIAEGNDYFHNKCGEAPVDEYIDIEWVIGKDIMLVKVNGELRHISDDYGYIERFHDNPDFTISSAVTVTTIFGATVTVERLRITEL